MSKGLGILVLCTILGMIGWAIVDFVAVFALGHRDADWQSGGLIAVGSGYFIQFETRCNSPVGLAEYDQRLTVSASGSGGQSEAVLGSVALFPNTGGRTHSLIFSYRGEDGSDRLQIQQRNGVIQDVELRYPRVRNLRNGSLSRVDPAENRVFIGTFIGISYPLRFVPSVILAEADSLAMIAPATETGEQSGAHQPATRPESEP
jgi:hypothetical protein